MRLDAQRARIEGLRSSDNRRVSPGRAYNILPWHGITTGKWGVRASLAVDHKACSLASSTQHEMLPPCRPAHWLLSEEEAIAYVASVHVSSAATFPAHGQFASPTKSLAVAGPLAPLWNMPRACRRSLALVQVTGLEQPRRETPRSWRRVECKTKMEVESLSQQK